MIGGIIMSKANSTGTTPEITGTTANLEMYNRVRAVPDEAQKPITGGRLSGKTDINPMWRIKTLTEQFGMAGVGWRYEVLKMWTEQSEENTIAAFVNINLYVKYNGEWSEPIFGTGGSMFKELQKGSPYTNDEAYKMALTDALSVSCKALGVAADIYWNKDNTKYNDSKRNSMENGDSKDNSGNNGSGENKPPEQKSASGGRKASEKQVTLINNIIADISKGYEAVGQNAKPDALIKRMKEDIKINKELFDFTTKEASAAIDYLTKIKLQIPKSKEAG
jgi:hypothetical protein